MSKVFYCTFKVLPFPGNPANSYPSSFSLLLYEEDRTPILKASKIFDEESEQEIIAGIATLLSKYKPSKIVFKYGFQSLKALFKKYNLRWGQSFVNFLDTEESLSSDALTALKDKFKNRLIDFKSLQGKL